MKHAIAAGHKMTAQAGDLILSAGGNAFDAAIGAFLTASVSEPCMCSLGGGFLSLLRTEDGRLFAVDAFTQTPGVKKKEDEVDFLPCEVNFGDESEIFCYGAGSIAVPGVVAGLFEINRKFGRMSMKEIAEPAIEAARKGVGVGLSVQHELQLLREILCYSSHGRSLFFKELSLKEKGDLIIMTGFADYLEFLTREGPNAFYRGEVAGNLIDSLQDRGHLSADDLSSYRVHWRKPDVTEFQTFNLISMPSPSIGGRLLSDFLHRVNEELKSGILIHDSFVRQIEHARNHSVANLKKGGTSHLSVIDGKGNAISLSMTQGEGSGIFIPGTDIQLNNMLGESALMPDGFHSWYPGTRMISMMSPSMTSNLSGELELVLGSGGAGRIPFMIGQVIAHFYLDQRGLGDATEHPRVFVDDRFIQVEGGEPEISLDHMGNNKEVNRWRTKSLYFGGVHSVLYRQDIFDAVGDQRRSGFGIVRN